MTAGEAADPAADERAEYDYESPDVARPALVDDLNRFVAGEVRFDSYSRQLYATDASIYEVTPIGVVFPASTEDVAAVMEYCAAREIPVLPRGGGTSLAGQAVNEAVVLDFTRHMDSLLDVDPGGRTARAQPGAILGDLNLALAEHDLKFAPDPAWGDKSALGGAIGNNSTGSHSLKYGKTDAYIEECEVVLADGTVATFGEVTLDELRERADPEGGLEARIHAEVARIVDEESGSIEEAFPGLKRNVSGYNLDRLVDEAESESVNLARLLAGSEGTLAVVTEATVALEPVPETKSMALFAYEDLLAAVRDVEPMLAHDAAAVELIDDVLIDLAEETEEFSDVVEMLPPGTNAVLLVEFYAGDDDEGRRKVADLFADRMPEATASVEPSANAAGVTDAPVHAFAALEAHDDAERARFWKLRKSGLPILLSRTSDEKHIAFIEDTAIPPANLAEYVEEFEDLLAENGTFASFYAHAGPGCLHIRPLVNTKEGIGVERMESIADGATDLVVKYGGSVSGEHGDGRARTQWNRKLYGDHVWGVFRDLKEAFDPDWLLNPGQVCGYDDAEDAPARDRDRSRTVDMTENLRFDPEYEFDAGLQPELNWENDEGFEGMVELCHGCGGCRGSQETTGGVMCPTYRAADEESTSTRGRANMLRRAMSGNWGEVAAASAERGDPPEEQFDPEFMMEIMDLCIGCKGCARDCPSEVDMAKLKIEVTNAYHERHGLTPRERLFANVDALNALGSAFAPLSNWGTKVPGARRLLEWGLGIARERSLPTFHRESLEDWFEERGGSRVLSTADRKVLLFPDAYTNYNHPDAGKAAVRVLEAAGVHVEIPDGVTSSGRPAHSKGVISKSREQAATNVDALEPYVEEGWDVVVVEPSDAVMFQHDYLDLLSGPAVDLVASNTYGVLEYVDRFRLDEGMAFDAPTESLTYHGHCHQKATKKDHHAVGVLRRAGYAVDPLDSGCCGMAGSFGYEAEHFSMSEAIGKILFEQVEDSAGETVVAPGASCRTQLGDWEESNGEPPHPVEKLADTLA